MAELATNNRIKDVADKPKNGFSMPVKMVWTAILMVSICHLGVTTFTKHFGLMIDGHDVRCIPEYSVYFVIKNVEHIERNGIYAFRAQGLEPHFKDGSILGKFVSGMPNDLVVQHEQGVFINNKKVLNGGYALTEKLGKDERDFYTRYYIPEGHYYLTGSLSADRSYDSRYWGTISKSQLIGKAIPLW